ncbi:MAG: DUF4352 domain-containing protein [Bacteroidota bacterium]|nr:DUF4352 domain-containing protein [Bacteroidota bacterium]
MKKITLIFFLALVFMASHYTMGQQVKPTKPKPAATPGPKVAAKPKPIAAKPSAAAKPAGQAEHKQARTEVGVTGMSSNFGACASITLKNATLDFWPTNSTNLENPKKTKKQFVRLEIDILSNCEEAYNYNYTSFRMKCSDGSIVMTSVHLDISRVPDQKTEIHELAKGQTLTTALYFEVPETETVNSLSFIVNGYDAAGVGIAMELKLVK